MTRAPSSGDSDSSSERPINDRRRRSASAPPFGESFDDVVLSHLEAAYRLARWLMRNEHDAEDVVQEASLRAFRYFHTFTGGNGRAWFLRIVRNCCHHWRGHSVQALTDPFDETQHRSARPASDPETLLLRNADISLIERTMSNLPDRFHQLLVLRELEGLSYRELADVVGIPIGTVMSRLARAREALRSALGGELKTRLSPVLEGPSSLKCGTPTRRICSNPSSAATGNRPPEASANERATPATRRPRSARRAA